MIDQLLQSFAAEAKTVVAASAAAVKAAPVMATPVKAAPVMATPVVVASIDITAACGKCGGEHHWKIRSNDQWFCMACQPPAVPSMVAAECGQPRGTSVEIVSVIVDSFDTNGSRNVVARYHYAVGLPCNDCRGKMIRETCWSDFSADVTCWTCGKNRQGIVL